MKQLELIIRQKTKTEIIEILEPLIHKITSETNYPYLYILKHSFTEDLKKLHILAQKELLNIKLRYYKRNLATLEILSEKQNLNPDITLALKIIRENLAIKHISKHLNTFNWYKIYKDKRIPNYLLKEIVL